ncbi:hypothetical protein O181_095879 [Austropuccinia psidii MF-1]|uniref:Uncharacterized protein n=1 Tax=Austropuccinia psidii MF-1 TaxID=1389203 RepID=A0A9Q3J682_9BASI|nr:hypothetical protein [Austropuccinia psidii MF-1]
MCPFYNRMDNIFGKKANVEALDKRDSTKSMAVMSEAEGETDIETSSNSDSDIPTSITPVSDTKSCINKKHGVTDPKSQSGGAKGRNKNLKDINDQKDRDMDNFHMRLFKNFIIMQQGKWTAEESILKEKSKHKVNLEKEKFERQLRMDAEQKEKDKVKNEREYNLEREKFERQLRIDAEEKDRREREFELEKERMEHQFQLEKERFDREAMMKERETRLGIARELILSGKSSDEIAAIMKAL